MISTTTIKEYQEKVASLEAEHQRLRAMVAYLGGDPDLPLPIFYSQTRRKSFMALGELMGLENAAEDLREALQGLLKFQEKNDGNITHDSDCGLDFASSGYICDCGFVEASRRARKAVGVNDE